MALEKESVAESVWDLQAEWRGCYKLRDFMKTRDMLCSMTMKIWPLTRRPALAKSYHEICAVCLTRYPWEQGIGANNQKHFLLFLTYTSLHCLGVAPMTLGQHWLDVAEKQTMTMTCVYGVWNWKNCLAVLLSNKNEDCWKSELQNIQGVCGVSLRYIHLQEKKIPYTQQSHSCIFHQLRWVFYFWSFWTWIYIHLSRKTMIIMTAKMPGKHLLDQSEANLEKTHGNLMESVFCMSSFHRMLFLQVSLDSILSLLLAGCLGRYCMQLLNEQYHSLKKNQTFIEQLQG